MSQLLNDGSYDAPKLCIYLNLDNLVDLRADSIFPPRATGAERDARLAADGFGGTQIATNDEPAPGATLPYCGLGRVSTPEEAEPLIARRAGRGDSCLTVHVGWGIEDDSECARLVEAVLRASERHRLPVFIETHRATITQDIWRTVQLTQRFPEIRFNGDFSHYYCGLEMPYGGLPMKIAFMAPIFDRIGFMHGRIANPGCMQAPVGPCLHSRPAAAHGLIDYVADFRQLWTRAMRGFLQLAGPGDVLIFAPELLAGTHYYARHFPDSCGQLAEETDRYAQALMLAQIARECFATAQRTPPRAPAASK